MSDADILDQAWIPESYVAQVFFRHPKKERLRSLHVLPSGDVLVISASGNGMIYLVWDDDKDGVADGSMPLLSSSHSLSHGIEYLLPENNEWTSKNEGLLLASSDHTVWYWTFTDDPTNRPTKPIDSLVPGKQLVININAQALDDDLGAVKGHWTRTLLLSSNQQRYLMISVGSAGNVDRDSYRSRIRRFDLWREKSNNGEDPNPFDFRIGEVFADGLRNEVGLALDNNGIVWGVENGADNLYRSDLGGDIHQDNPAEELNRFDGPIGTFYGYPYCWTEYNLPSNVGKGRGTVWAWPGNNPKNNDQWCRMNSKPPALSMQGHSAPLGITFYQYQQQNQTIITNPNSTCHGAFPKELNGDAFIAFHGSWNRDIPTGYKVVHVPFDTTTGNPLYQNNSGVIDFFRYNGTQENWPSGVRPVDVKFDICGRLLISDDAAGRIYLMSFNATPETLYPPSTAFQHVMPTMYGIFSFCLFLLSFSF